MQVCKVCLKDVREHVLQVKRCDVETFVKQIERYIFFQQVIFSITGAARGKKKKEEQQQFFTHQPGLKSDPNRTEHGAVWGRLPDTRARRCA